MFITETTEGDEPQRYEFNAKRITLSRAAMLETRYKKLSGDDSATVEQIWLGAIQGGAVAQRVILWHCKNVIHPTLKIEDVDPFVGEVEVRPSTGEVEQLRAAVETNKALDDRTRELMLGSLEAMVEAQVESEVDEAGKAPSPSSDDATG